MASLAAGQCGGQAPGWERGEPEAALRPLKPPESHEGCSFLPSWPDHSPGQSTVSSAAPQTLLPPPAAFPWAELGRRASCSGPRQESVQTGPLPPVAREEGPTWCQKPSFCRCPPAVLPLSGYPSWDLKNWGGGAERAKGRENHRSAGGGALWSGRGWKADSPQGKEQLMGQTLTGGLESSCQPEQARVEGGRDGGPEAVASGLHTLFVAGRRGGVQKQSIPAAPPPALLFCCTSL